MRDPSQVPNWTSSAVQGARGTLSAAQTGAAAPGSTGSPDRWLLVLAGGATALDGGAAG